jgi:predicted nucleic acid-binding protein
MIAAAAIQAGAPLATANPRDFAHFAGAGLELAEA